MRNTSSERNGEDTHLSSPWDGGGVGQSLSRITRAASHQAKEIVGGNEVTPRYIRSVFPCTAKRKEREKKKRYEIAAVNLTA